MGRRPAPSVSTASRSWSTQSVRTRRSSAPEDRATAFPCDSGRARLQRTTCSPLRSPRDQALPPRHEVLVPLPSIVVQSKTRISQLKLTCHEPEKSPNQPLYLITAPDISVIFGARGKLGYTLRATVRTRDFARCHLDASAKGQCPTASGIKPDERVAGTTVDRPPQTHARDIHRLLHSSHSSDGAVPP